MQLSRQLRCVATAFAFAFKFGWERGQDELSARIRSGSHAKSSPSVCGESSRECRRFDVRVHCVPRRSFIVLRQYACQIAISIRACGLRCSTAGRTSTAMMILTPSTTIHSRCATYTHEDCAFR
eukprot:4799160-Pleurochrysis_carterae.AAC.3